MVQVRVEIGRDDDAVRKPTARECLLGLLTVWYRHEFHVHLENAKNMRKKTEMNQNKKQKSRKGIKYN